MDPAQYQIMDAVEDSMWWYRALHAEVLDALAASRPDPGPLLDAGCGTGGFLARLRQARPDLAAVGLEHHLPAARRAAAKSGRPVLRGTVHALPFAEASFAAVVSLDVLCHAAVDPVQALPELRRVLCPGGVLVLNLPAFDWLRSGHDVEVQNARRFTARGVAAMLARVGLAGIRLRYWNSLLLPLMVARRKLVARAMTTRSDVARYPAWLDDSLHATTRLERRLRAIGIPFPAGGSVLATAHRP
ncbi:class I SAM-dependent methyltransferase [Roseicella frigidaeris]|uniref:Class I SAM-dependent methyltransferase n=1 Tax=Roseicella frigidaeris TaxID=2230885 RepID=A0A327MB69_9PROT|nr:class I SAM-dependent methyltransferase [Roseicella frigidaeris]RAI60531.1 class I SAM-dependent methyltransferase [Roseicella frigidaeris]